MKLTAPVPISENHDCSKFSCGTPSLDEWLRRRALSNQRDDASRTYVLCEDQCVIAYFALASSSVALIEAAGRFRRNMPDPISVIVLARLAVDTALKSKGLGRALFRDAAFRVLAAADIIGARGMIVHAVSDEACAFYEAVGMRASPLSPMTLMLTCADLRMGLRNTD